MSLEIPSYDRILNKTLPISLTDKTLLNALNVMTMLDSIVNGAYNQKLAGGLESDKPASPEVREVYIVAEASYFATEVYTAFGWLILKGIWTNSDNRPPTTGLAPGSEGFNTESGQKEFWDGTEWRLI